MSRFVHGFAQKGEGAAQRIGAQTPFFEPHAHPGEIVQSGSPTSWSADGPYRYGLVMPGRTRTSKTSSSPDANSRLATVDPESRSITHKPHFNRVLRREHDLRGASLPSMSLVGRSMLPSDAAPRLSSDWEPEFLMKLVGPLDLL